MSNRNVAGTISFCCFTKLVGETLTIKERLDAVKIYFHRRGGNVAIEPRGGYVLGHIRRLAGSPAYRRKVLKREKLYGEKHVDAISKMVKESIAAEIAEIEPVTRPSLPVRRKKTMMKVKSNHTRRVQIICGH